MGLDNVICITPFYGRPKVSKIFLENIKDLGVKLISITDLGDNENIELCEEYAFKNIISHQNITGAKWNRGLLASRSLDWEYVLILGSDDLISSRYFEDFAFDEMEKGTKYLGLLDAIAVNLCNKKFRYWSGYKNFRLGESIGCGRLIHRSVIEELNYNIFPNVRKGTIDLHSDTLINTVTNDNKFIKSVLKPYRIGLKSGFDITKELEGCPFRFDIELEGYYSENVIDLIRDFRC